MRLAVEQHLHALDRPGARVLFHNAIEPAPPWVAWTAPDLCVLHPTFLGVRWNEDFAEYRRRFRWVASLACPKVALPQDEYDHSEILEEWLLELGATRVYSCFGAEQRALLYPQLGSDVPCRETLTGFVDTAAAEALSGRIVPHAERRWDIVYRTTKLPYWFGSHGQLKHRIAEAAQRAGEELGLEMDISTRPEDTIYGGWLDFLMSGRAVIGTESGSSVLDRRGELQQRIRRLTEQQPELTFEEVDAQMPPGWDSYSFFAISPRHLEAVITKTAQVLVEGTYSGVLEPERHYIPVRRDLADLDEALGRLRDREAVEAMTERAYRDVYLEGGHTLEDFADSLRAEAGRRARLVAVPFALATRLPARTLPERVARWHPLRTMTGARLLLAATLLGELARNPRARRLALLAVRGRSGLGARDIAWDLIFLRILSRIRATGRGQGEPWALNTESLGCTLTIHTERSSQGAIRLEGPVETVVWDHSAVAEAVPLYPGRPQWAWAPLGPAGRHEFRALAVAARANATEVRAILERTLAP
ncbi:MAG TPA: hypothetical protein VFA37_05840 [Gaiellaceae bacterium]|nr:hypothetical protein [Gaiellaceae bacterium]